MRHNFAGWSCVLADGSDEPAHESSGLLAGTKTLMAFINQSGWSR